MIWFEIERIERTSVPASRMICLRSLGGTSGECGIGLNGIHTVNGWKYE